MYGDSEVNYLEGCGLVTLRLRQKREYSKVNRLLNRDYTLKYLNLFALKPTIR
jgi:hypothetical protein